MILGKQFLCRFTFHYSINFSNNIVFFLYVMGSACSCEEGTCCHSMCFPCITCTPIWNTFYVGCAGINEGCTHCCKGCEACIPCCIGIKNICSSCCGVFACFSCFATCCAGLSIARCVECDCTNPCLIQDKGNMDIV